MSGATYSPFTGHWSDCYTQETLDASDCTCYARATPGAPACRAAYADSAKRCWLTAGHAGNHEAPDVDDYSVWVWPA